MPRIASLLPSKTFMKFCGVTVYQQKAEVNFIIMIPRIILRCQYNLLVHRGKHRFHWDD